MSPQSQVRLLYVARGIRGFGDGFAIIVLPAYLTAIGYSPIEVGITTNGQVEVRKGLSVGETVVASGTLFIDRAAIRD